MTVSRVVRIASMDVLRKVALVRRRGVEMEMRSLFVKD